MIPDRAEIARRTAPRTILLVEDEPDARTILARRLQAFGWNCLPHSSVETALHDPDLRYVDAVVADVVLGEGKMSGIDLIPALRKQEVRAPVVLVTAFADTQRVKAALNAGASYLLEKPFTTEALRQILDKVTTADVLPWLFFAFRLRSIYEPVTGVLAYRSFLHPLAELDGFLGCFAAGVILTALRPPPAGWQIVVAAVAPLISATCAAIGQWQLGQVASLALLAVMLQFTLRRLSRPLSPSLLWIAFGFLMGAGGAAVAELAATRGSSWFWVHEMGRDLVIQGL